MEKKKKVHLNHIWQRTFPFKALIAIFWDLQPLWPSSLTKPDLLRFRCPSGHVLSKTKSVTPHFFHVSDITNSSSFNGTIFRKKSQCWKLFARTSLKLKWIYYQALFKKGTPASRHRDARKLRHKTEIRGLLFGTLTAKRVSFVSTT